MGGSQTKPTSNPTPAFNSFARVPHMAHEIPQDSLSKYIFIKDEELNFLLEMSPLSSWKIPFVSLKNFESIWNNPSFNLNAIEQILVFIHHHDRGMSEEKFQIVNRLKELCDSKLVLLFVMRSDIQVHEAISKLSIPYKTLHYVVEHNGSHSHNNGSQYQIILDPKSQEKLTQFLSKIQMRSQNHSTLPMMLKEQSSPVMPILNCLLILDTELESKCILDSLLSKIHNRVKRVKKEELAQLEISHLDNFEPDCVFALLHQDGRIPDLKQSNLSLLDQKYGQKLITCVIRRNDINIGEVASVKFDKTVIYRVNYETTPYVTYLETIEEQKMMDYFLSCLDRFEGEKKAQMKGKDLKEELIKKEAYIQYLQQLLSKNDIPYKSL